MEIFVQKRDNCGLIHAAVADSAARGGRVRYHDGRDHNLRGLGRLGGRGRRDGRGAEAYYGEGNDEGANGDVFHFAYFSLAV